MHGPTHNEGSVVKSARTNTQQEVSFLRNSSFAILKLLRHSRGCFHSFVSRIDNSPTAIHIPPEGARTRSSSFRALSQNPEKSGITPPQKSRSFPRGLSGLI